MNRLPFVVCVLAVCLNPSNSLAADLDNAFPSFTTSGKTAVPADFQHIALELQFDPATSRATGRCEIEFTTAKDGYPVMDLVPEATKVVLNGTDLGRGGLPRISSPDSATRLRLINGAVKAGTTNTVVIEYPMNSSDVSFTNAGARIVWSMSDIGSDSHFLERYACANLEFDRFPMTMTVEVLGTPASHQIFTNGELSIVRNGFWRIRFPDYFTSSSFFFHLTNRPFVMESKTYKGLTKDIPVVVYGATGTAISTAMQRSLSVLKELESTYGPYAHDSLTVFLNNSFGGGMEHVGATITTLGALDHEITHSWFARGVMPADGNAGWIDEAIASWRDEGYPRGRAGLTGSASQLSGFSNYRRSTTMDAYTAGMNLMSRFDALFSGLKGTLKEVFSRHQRTTISTPQFQQILKDITGQDVSSYFDRYVYARGARHTLSAEPMSFLHFPKVGKHPPPLSDEEVARLR